MDAIISVDENQNIVLFNAAAERIFGYRAQEVMGKPLDILIPERFRAIHRQHVYHFGQTGETTRAMGKETNMDLFALRSDGTEFPIDASISQVVVEGKRLYTAILRDITSRKTFEQELVAREGGVGAQQDGVAVGRGLGGQVAGDDFVGAAPVVHQHRLVPQPAQALGQAPGHAVDGAAGRVGHDELDRLVGEGAGLG